MFVDFVGGHTMSALTPYCLVLTTTSTSSQAEELAKGIVERRLAACVQVQQITSFYTWNGESCTSPECILLIKTRLDRYSALETFVLEQHCYETPEIIQIPITAGFSGYLRWIDECTIP